MQEVYFAFREGEGSYVLKSLNCVAWAFLFVFVAVARTDAALIIVSEGSDTGGGTVISDGSVDVKSQNGSSSGFTSLMSQLGLTDANLDGDLANLTVRGFITDTTPGDSVFGTALTANLAVLRITGTLATACADPSLCATLTEVQVGGTLGLQGPNFDFNPDSVIFAFDIVGTFDQNPRPWDSISNTPQGLSTPQVVPTGQSITYTLSQAQIDFIVDIMAAYSVNQVRIGFGALAQGISDINPEGKPVRTQFEIETVPEPSALLLLGTGVVIAGLRRRRPQPNH